MSMKQLVIVAAFNPVSGLTFQWLVSNADS
jgi:hypothetical protein